MRTLIRFSRLHTIIGTSLSVVSLFVLAWLLLPDPAGPAWLLPVTLVASLGANLYIVGLNQLTDIEIDRINKPGLPLASGELAVSTGRAWVVTAGVLALVLAALSGPYLFITVVASMIIGTLYSLPPVRLKRFHFWAAASIFTVRGLVVNLFMYLHFQISLGGTTMLPAAIWLLTAFIFALSLVIAWFKDMPDIAGDRQFQIVTLSVRLGARRVFRLGMGVLSLCYLGMIAAGMVGVAGLNSAGLIIAHAALLVVAWWQARLVEVDRPKSVTRYYRFIWVLFYLEYLVFPLIAGAA
jgi:homogentisate phytyltransferase/homogentisate geranylgeranyltransferase